MAQSALTVTPPTPTPPTNFQFWGVTGPNPPNITKVNYANPFNLSPAASGAGGSTIYTDSRPVQTIPGVGVNPNPPGYVDDGTPATALAFATNRSAVAGGTGATSGGTEGTYPGTDTAPMDMPNQVGPVPASSSAPHEGAGLEAAVTQSYAAGVLVPGDASTYTVAQTPAFTVGDPGGKLRSFGVTPALTPGTLPSPNGTHASSLSPTGAATITTFSPANTTSGGGTFALTVNGTNFTSQSVVYINDVAMTTVYVNSTQLTVAAAIKRPTAGTYPVRVVTSGVSTAATNYTYT